MISSERIVVAVLLTAPFSLLLGACTPTVPPELLDARQAYQRAATGPASQASPAEVHKAEVTLQKAEAAFKEEPKTQETRDLAYIAQRKAMWAEAQAGIAIAEREKAKAEQALGGIAVKIQARTVGELYKTRAQLAAAEAARLAAEAKAQEALARLAKTKSDSRGLVITLSGGVLFASGQYALLYSAQNKLNEVADALVKMKGQTIVVEGHTDNRGNANLNQDLSQRRAETVREYLVGRGVQSERIRAIGFGMSRPTTSNGSAEGRANNRRVEIVVQRPASAGP